MCVVKTVMAMEKAVPLSFLLLSLSSSNPLEVAEQGAFAPCGPRSVRNPISAITDHALMRWLKQSIERSLFPIKTWEYYHPDGLSLTLGT